MGWPVSLSRATRTDHIYVRQILLLLTGATLLTTLLQLQLLLLMMMVMVVMVVMMMMVMMVIQTRVRVVLGVRPGPRAWPVMMQSGLF